MIERINKPEAPPSYRVQAAKETKEDQSRKQQHQEGKEAYQKALKAGDWNKFRGRTMTIKPVKVPRDRINKVLFRSAVLHSGMAILEAGVIWKDGRTTEPVLFLMSRTEDYMRLKVLKKGEVVPEHFWARGAEIELGIVQMESQSGSWGAQELEHEAKIKKEEDKRKPLLSYVGLVDQKTRRFQWFTLAMYIIGISMVIMIIVYARQ